MCKFNLAGKEWNNFYCLHLIALITDMRDARHSQFEEIRNLLQHVDQQIRRSQELFPHELTVANRSQQDLTLTISIEDQQPYDSTPITLPAHTVFTRKIYSSQEHIEAICPSLQQVQPSSRNVEEEKPWSIKIRDADSGVKASGRQEKKFQPISHVRRESQEQLIVQQEISSKEKELKGNDFEKFSSKRIGLPPAEYTTNTHEKEFQTKESAQSQKEKPDLKESQFLINEFSVDSKASSEFVSQNINSTTPLRGIRDQAVQSDHIAFPFTLMPQTERQGFEQSPQVYSYLLGTFREKQPEISTPINPINKQDDAINFSLSFFSNTNTKPKIRQNSSKKADRLSPVRLAFQPKEESSKSYRELSKQKSAFKRKNQYQGINLNKRMITSPARQPSQSPNQRLPYRPSSGGIDKSHIHIQEDKPFVPSRRADDLFYERKATFLNKLQNQVKKPYQRNKIQSKDGSKSSHYQEQAYPSIRQLKISPKAIEISQRLYSKSKDKIPCDHQLRYTKEKERERFDNLVRQNSFVERHIGRKEQDMLFQTLRQSGQSVSVWPMKIVNYTYNKISRLNRTLTDTRQ